MDDSPKPLPKMLSIETIAAKFELQLEERTVEALLTIDESTVTIRFDSAHAEGIKKGLAIGSLLPLQEVVQAVMKALKDGVIPQGGANTEASPAPQDD